jgi:hypothetical protein
MTEAEMQVLKAEWGTREAGANYNLLVDGQGTGLAPPTEEEWASMVGRTKVLDGTITADPGLPAAYDLSTQPFFPKVGNQGSQGSCSAWAATYYSYGYLEALDNNWSDAKAGSNPAHLMSPAWTYNRVNGGADNGSWMGENLQVIVDWGVASMATMPYSQSDLLSWGSPVAFREAPLHRASGYAEEYWLKGSEAVAAVKNRVASNMPVTFALDANQYRLSFQDNTIMSAHEYNSYGQNHANTIVGYNDSIGEDGELGAFRVVNSWGASWGDGGYYWLTYDALMEISNGAGLFLTEVADLTDYVPQMLAVWHFDTSPPRSATIQVSNGKSPTVVRTLTPSYAADAKHNMPTFMCLDITELAAGYEAGNTSFWIKLASGSSGVLSSFRIERYENGYVPGSATQASSQSLDVPKAVPCRAVAEFPEYAPVGPAEALDSHGLVTTIGGQASWVGVPMTSAFNGSCLQSGDVGDGGVSSFQVTIAGCAGVDFQWKVSSEAGKDAFRFLIDGTLMLDQSGTTEWQGSNYLVSMSPHILRWEYVKDQSNSGGKDMAWVDHLGLMAPDDRFEDNDVPAQAAPLNSSGYYPGLMCLDDDWYKIWLNTSDALSLQVDHEPVDGSLAAHLYEPDAATLIDSSQSANGSDSLITGRVALSGYYFLWVRSPGGDFLPYSITCVRTSGWFDEGSTSRLQVISGTGDFENITSTQRRMTAWTGSSLTGSVSVHGTANWNSTVQVPLVATPNWGDPASVWRTVSSNMTRGNATYIAYIDNLLLPYEPGSYYLLFGARNESGGDYLCSSTSSLRPSPVWNDGNDLAALPTDRIDQAVQTGRTVVQWLMADSTELVWLPADAIRFDVQAPDIAPPITSARAAGTLGEQQWYRSLVSVTLTATDGAGSGVESTTYRIDGGQWRTYGSLIMVSLDGNHLLEYHSRDSAGNIEVIRTLAIKIDKAPPALGLTSGGEVGQAGWYVSPVTVGISSQDLTSGPGQIFVRIDSEDWAESNGTEVRLDQGGEHLVEVYALDVAGNPSGVQVMSVPIDLMAPNTTLQVSGAHHSGDWYSGGVSLNLTALDLDSGVASTFISLDGAPFLPYSGNVSLAASGQHDISFYSVDRAGNGEGIKNATVLVDATPPDCWYNLRAGEEHEGWYISPVVLELNASDGQSGLGAIMYRIGAEEWQSYSGNLSFEDGVHSVEFYALDRVGVESEHQTVVLQVDASGPECAAELQGILGTPGWYLSDVVLNLTALDELSSVQEVQYRWGGSEWSSYSQNLSMGDEGEHWIEFRAFDNAGNQGPVTNLTFGIDRSAPISRLKAEGDAGEKGWFVSAVRISGNSTDATSGAGDVLLCIDGGPWTDLSEEVYLQADGVSLLRYYSVDRAGNREATREMIIKLDRSAPTIWLNLSGPLSAHGWYGAEVNATLESSDWISGPNQSYYKLDGGDWVRYEAPFKLGEGSHLLEWYATDLAGNFGNRSSQVIDVDLSSPLTSPRMAGTVGNSGWYLTDVGLTFDAADRWSGLNRTLYKLDSAAWSEFSAPIRVEGEGTHAISYYSIDRAGNVEVLRNLTLRIDLQAPVTAYLLSGDRGKGDWFVTPVNLSLSARDSVSGPGATTYRLDRGEWLTYGRPVQVASSGRHEVEIRSADGAGNQELAMTLHLDMDLTAPQVRCNDSGRTFVTPDLSIALWVEENLSGIAQVEMSVDGGAALQVDWHQGALVIQGLADGPHQVRLTVTDQAGNSVVEVLDLRVDTNPLSPQGPWGPWLLVSMVMAIALLVGFFGLRGRRKG